MLFAKIEPVATYFYLFIWWSYIFFVDGLVFWIKGSSLFSRLRGKIFLLIFFSFLFWLFFEILNLRIANWYYIGPFFHPIGMIIFGIFTFGTVLPIILVTYELLDSLNFWRNLRFPRWKWWGRPKYFWISIGIIMLILPLSWPKYFFWTIWQSLIFILDPIVESNGGKSLFQELREGKARTFCLLLLTGLITGILWEFWNYWAELKWQYTVPLIPQWKIFEMPLLGYLVGFSFFAPECYLFYQLLQCRLLKRGEFS